MQYRDAGRKREDIIQRILYYWSRTYIRDIKEGENYDKLQRTIAVLIADFEIPQLEELNYITKWKLIETEEKKSNLDRQNRNRYNSFTKNI